MPMTHPQVVEYIREWNTAKQNIAWAAWFEFGESVEDALVALKQVAPASRKDGSSQIIRTEFQPGREVDVTTIALRFSGVALDYGRVAIL